MLVSTDNTVTKLQLNSTKDGVYWADGNPDGNTDGTPPTAKLATINGGTVDAYLQVINGDGSGTGEYGGMGVAYFTNKLNTFAKGFDNMLNTFAAEYQTITPPTTVDTASSALVYIGDSVNPAADIAISTGWQTDADLFKKNYTGSSIGNYAGELINTIKQNGTVKLTDIPTYYSGSILDFSDSFTSDIATALNHTQGMADSTSSIVSNIDAQRQSISSVSIDEEAINIIRFQQSYNASARVITAIDEMLDKLINSTGIVGR
jgi:flagellar hook-associated protein 1 FlgK